MQEHTPDIPDNDEASLPSIDTSVGKLRRAATILLSLVVVAAGVVGAAYLNKSGPRAQKRPPVREVPLVETVTLTEGTEQVMIPAMGSVVPARTLTLKSRVAGEVVRLHPEFIDGGLVKKGEILVTLDGQDYRLAIARQQSVVTQAEFELKLELGHQEVARREWDLLNQSKYATGSDESLALRKPHLDKAQAALAAAKAALAQAELDLERTVIRAPFNAIVRHKQVAVGAQVTTQEALGELVGTDTYWVEVPVAVNWLQWIQIPRRGSDGGALARIVYQNGHVRQGRVIKLLGELESEGRMARVLVAVTDPLNLDSTVPDAPRLLIGEFVRVEISGKRVDAVIRIPRHALRDDRFVWIAGDGDTLDIRPVVPIWRTPDDVLLRNGIRPGERLIISDLPNPVQGMPITTKTTGEKTGGKKGRTAS